VTHICDFTLHISCYVIDVLSKPGQLQDPLPTNKCPEKEPRGDSTAMGRPQMNARGRGGWLQEKNKQKTKQKNTKKT